MDTALRTPSTSIERVETAHKLLTIEEAAAEMRICLSHAYELAHEYLNSGGTTGLPVLRFGTCMRVPRWALDVLITTGRVVRLADAAVPPTGSTVRADTTNRLPRTPPRPSRATATHPAHAS